MRRGVTKCLECEKPQKARNLCQGHYDKARRSGRLQTATRTRTDVLCRDDLGRKLCIRCLEWLDEGQYSSNVARKDGLSPYCRPCIKALWVAQERDKRYGLEPGTVLRIFQEQQFKCAICGHHIDDSAHVDHDHECCTGRGKACGQCVRGVLCRSCNNLLGNANDSVEVLYAAARYLEKWGNRQ